MPAGARRDAASARRRAPRAAPRPRRRTCTTCSAAASAASSSRAARRSRARSSPPASPTSCSSTSRPRCSAAPASPSATSASPPSRDARAPRLRRRRAARRRPARRRPTPDRPKGTDECSPESSRSSATVTRVERSADAARLTVRGTARRARTPRTATRSRSRACASPSSTRRRLVHGRRHGADPRDVHPRWRDRRPPRSTSSAPPSSATASAATSCRATSTAPPRVLGIRPGDAWRVLRFSLDDALAPLVVDKGSIAVDGVSLTVSALGDEPDGSWFEVSLIPETLAATTLGAPRGRRPREHRDRHPGPARRADAAPRRAPSAAVVVAEPSSIAEPSAHATSVGSLA